MKYKSKGVKIKRISKKIDLWEVNLTLRLYIILHILIFPIVFFFIHLNYFSPLGIIILGGASLLILRYVIFTSQKGSSKHFKIQFGIVFFIMLNYLIGLIYFINSRNLAYILLIPSIFIGSISFIVIALYLTPLKRINSFFTARVNIWKNNSKLFPNLDAFFKRITLLWLIISLGLIMIPYPIYFQGINTQINNNPHRDFGIWTYGQSFNEDKIGDPEYITNQTLEKLGKAKVYFVYGVNIEKIDSKLVKNLIRCRDHDIEVHISVNPIKVSYTNVWTFENFRDDIEEVLDYLDSHDLIGNPVKALVYDMEVMPDAKYPFYDFNQKVIAKLNEYDEIETKFRRFNNRIREEFDLEIRITTDISQGFDLKDGDNDLMVFSGLLSDEKADMAYMVYRRETLGQNVILDHCRFLKEGDIIILNAWRDFGSVCWKDLECAIKDAQLVLGYPKKSYRLEIWALSYFLISFGENGLVALVDAINQEVSEWSVVIVWNTFPYSFWWDFIFFGYIIIDLYGPIFRLIYKIF